PRCTGVAHGRQRIGASCAAAPRKAVALYDRGVRRFVRKRSTQAAAGDTPPAEKPGFEPGCARHGGPVPRDGPLARQTSASADVVLDRRFRGTECRCRSGCPPACAETIREVAWPPLEGLAARDGQTCVRARRAIDPEWPPASRFCDVLTRTCCSQSDDG